MTEQQRPCGEIIFIGRTTEFPRASYQEGVCGEDVVPEIINHERLAVVYQQATFSQEGKQVGKQEWVMCAPGGDDDITITDFIASLIKDGIIRGGIMIKTSFKDEASAENLIPLLPEEIETMRAIFTTIEIERPLACP